MVGFSPVLLADVVRTVLNLPRLMNIRQLHRPVTRSQTLKDKLRRLIEGLAEDSRDVGVGILPGDAGTRVAAQAVQSPLDEAAPS
ncbi:hypothetical protein [Streptomyces sp. AGS-58]|uniref:hypothetical protein n=1 Tax=unclassified Streptomyces TaxID=2593676 RepID=UPI0035A26647